MASDCTSLMFIDSDIGFEGRDVLELLLLQADNSDDDIIGARYRVKNLSGAYACNHDPTGTSRPAFTREPVPVCAGHGLHADPPERVRAACRGIPGARLPFGH
jgi:hypothetical protein